jgi:hypothetical protein
MYACLLKKSSYEVQMEKNIEKKMKEEEAEEEEASQPSYKPPLTPFGGLPAPDAPRVKKPVKTVRPAGILYATPVEIR